MEMNTETNNIPQTKSLSRTKKFHLNKKSSEGMMHSAVQKEETAKKPAEQPKKMNRSERAELRQSKKENGEEHAKEPKKFRIRLIPIWLRILIVLVLIIVFFFIGAMIGYGIIGDGSPWDVFKKSTWTHIIDIVTKGT